MNKKGFTLTEIMAVVAIIAIIILIAVPSIIAINKNMNKRVYEQKKETIVAAAEIYANNNPNLFSDSDRVYVYVYELIEKNYLSADVNNNTSNCTVVNNGNNGCMINPIDKTSMNGDYVIITKQSVGVKVEYYNEVTSTNEEIISDSTLVEQICTRFKNGTFVGKFDSGENDYCMCGIEAKGLYKAIKDSNGNLQRTNNAVNACIISGDDVNNYLRYQNVMWRVIGLYNLYNNSDKLVAKMITDDIVDN